MIILRELLFACNIPHTGNGPRVHDFSGIHSQFIQWRKTTFWWVWSHNRSLALAAYLGHKSYRETCWYIHLTVASVPVELSQKLDRAFPRHVIPVEVRRMRKNRLLPKHWPSISNLSAYYMQGVSPNTTNSYRDTFKQLPSIFSRKERHSPEII